MKKTLKAAFPALVLLAVGTTTVAAVNAQQPAAPAMQQHGMMSTPGTAGTAGTPGMMGMMGQMDPARMKQMMDNCNMMMQSRGAPQPPAGQQPKG